MTDHDDDDDPSDDGLADSQDGDPSPDEAGAERSGDDWPEDDDADGQDDDEDEVEDEVEGDDEAAASIAASTAGRRRGSRRLGPALLGVGGSIWALVAVMRCGGPATEVPSLAVEQTEASTPAEPVPAPAPGPVAAEPADPDLPELPADETDAGADSSDPAPTDPKSIPKPRPAPAAWVADLHPPDVVRYTIRRGGSAENVANLFKIFHHEILELNPGIELAKELPPNSRLVVYRRDENATSESVGLPSNGSLEGGVPMVEGPGRLLKAIPWKSFATATTVAILDHILRDWADRGHRQPILVGNMAARRGGKLPPHSTHQSGRDVDLGYPQKLAAGAELNWVNIDETTLDAAATWDLLFSLARSGTVEVIYVDRNIQKLLYDWARSQNLMSKAQLSGWMEYPRPTGSGNPLMQHVKGHVDHLHARFRCQPHEKRCQSKP